MMGLKIMKNGRFIQASVMMTGVFLASAYVHGHELSGGYAKLLSLQVSENISASGLRDDGERYRKIAVPWHSECQPAEGGVCPSVWVKGNYMDVKSDIEEEGTFHWKAYGLSVGGDMKVRLSERVSLRGGVGVGYSRIYNRSHGLEDFTELDWQRKNVLFISPEIEAILTFGDFSLRPGISFLSARERPSRRKDIGTRTGSYALRGAYTFRDAFTLKGQAGNVIVGNNTGGFYGAGYRDDLGFSLVNETQVLADIPFSLGGSQLYIRTGPGILLTDNGAKGVSFTFSLKI
ncbi:UNVERIFIED_ORG: hypothetical protein FHU01_4477 [Citrobacter freundii]